MAEEMQMRMIEVSGRRCLFVCDVLAEYFPEQMFHFNIWQANGQCLKLSGEISRYFADVIYDEIRELNVVSIGSSSQKNLVSFVRNVIPHLWKDRDVAFRFYDGEEVHYEVLEWNTSNPLSRTYNILTQIGKRYEPGSYTRITIN